MDILCGDKKKKKELCTHIHLESAEVPEEEQIHLK